MHDVGTFIRIAALCFACVVCQACSERVESYYPALSDAVHDGAVTRGWIPDLLPESSRSIHEIHSPDSPRTWCAFEFRPGDSRRLEKLAVVGDALPATVRQIEDPGPAWWPEVLKGKLDVAAIHHDGFALFTVEEPPFGAHIPTNLVLFAVGPSTGRGFFYRVPEPWPG